VSKNIGDFLGCRTMGKESRREGVAKMPSSAFEAKCRVPGNAELHWQLGAIVGELAVSEAFDSAF